MKKWKVLFWILALATAKEYYDFPSSSQKSILDFLYLISNGILLIPFYGFAYQTAIGWKKLWQIVFLALIPITSYYVLGSILMRLYLSVLVADYIGFLLLLIVATFYGVLLIPQFKYAFRSNQLWASNV